MQDKHISRCGVCGEVKPASEYCSNECWTLDKSQWKDNVIKEDVIAALMGAWRAGRYLPTVVKQIKYAVEQKS